MAKIPFFLHLKPIINGTGNYYIEAQTRDQTRTDVIVDYLGEQYVIELKKWRGDRYNEKGEKQIAEYLGYFHLTTGYMLSFNFNKNKEIGVKRIEYAGKVLYEGRYTVFKFDDQRIKFIAPYSLERYLNIVQWDKGYMFLKPINRLEVAYD